MNADAPLGAILGLVGQIIQTIPSMESIFLIFLKKKKIASNSRYYEMLSGTYPGNRRKPNSMEPNLTVL